MLLSKFRQKFTAIAGADSIVKILLEVDHNFNVMLFISIALEISFGFKSKLLIFAFFIRIQFF